MTLRPDELTVTVRLTPMEHGVLAEFDGPAIRHTEFWTWDDLDHDPNDDWKQRA